MSEQFCYTTFILNKFAIMQYQFVVIVEHSNRFSLYTLAPWVIVKNIWHVFMVHCVYTYTMSTYRCTLICLILAF